MGRLERHRYAIISRGKCSVSFFIFFVKEEKVPSSPRSFSRAYFIDLQYRSFVKLKRIKLSFRVWRVKFTRDFPFVCMYASSQFESSPGVTYSYDSAVTVCRLLPIINKQSQKYDWHKKGTAGGRKSGNGSLQVFIKIQYSEAIKEDGDANLSEIISRGNR